MQARSSQGILIHSGIMTILQRIICQYFAKYQLMLFHGYLPLFIYGWGEGQESAQGVFKEGGPRSYGHDHIFKDSALSE